MMHRGIKTVNRPALMGHAEHEIDKLAREFRLTPKQIKEAIHMVGNDKALLKRYFCR